MANCYVPNIINNGYSGKVLQCPICKTKTGTQEFRLLEERTYPPQQNQAFTMYTPFIPPSKYYHKDGCENKNKGIVLDLKNCPPYLQGGFVERKRKNASIRRKYYKKKKTRKSRHKFTRNRY
jgi:hypothetical protein